jgi:diguanylate cyclase (GGDEF)-like protein
MVFLMSQSSSLSVFQSPLSLWEEHIGLFEQTGYGFFSGVFHKKEWSFSQNIPLVFTGLVEVLKKVKGDFIQLCPPEEALRLQEALAHLKKTGSLQHLEVMFCLPAHHTEYWAEITFSLSKNDPEAFIGHIKNITNQKREYFSLRYLAHIDEHTGLLNRNQLKQKLATTLAVCLQNKHQGAYLVASIDQLNHVNRIFGYDIADELIRGVSQRLSSIMRSGDVIGRIGGGKFGLILHDYQESDLSIVAKRMMKTIQEQIFETHAGPISVTLSMGGTFIPKNSRTVIDVFAQAEEALGTAKGQGQDSFILYQPNLQLQNHRHETMNIAQSIVDALKEDRLMLAFQSMVDVHDEKPRLYETLARIKNPDGSLMLGGQFIPVAEKVGLIGLIDRRISDMSIKTLHQHPDLKLSVNISAATTQDKIWMEKFLDLIRNYRGVADRLTIEITETVSLSDIESSIKFVSTLRDLGCKIAIDDFGVGYTSFATLKSLKIDMLKIDGIYIKGIHNQTDNQVFVRSLLKLAQHFQITTVAEMIGEPEEAFVCKQMGIDLLQGFYYQVPTIGTPWVK